MTNYTVIQNELITSNLSDGAYRLYNFLLSMCYGDKTECYPCQDYISNKLNKSVRTIQRYLDELINAKLVSKRRRGSISNVYTLLTKKLVQKADKVVKKVKETYNIKIMVEYKLEMTLFLFSKYWCIILLIRHL